MSASVITSAASSRLARLEDVRTDLSLSETTWSDDKLGRLVDQASARAISYCRRTFGRQIYRERFNAWDLGLELVLDASPITRIISVRVGGQVLDPAEYEFDDLRLYRLFGGHRCAWIGREMVVEYEAGWLLPGEEVGTVFTGAIPLPADVEKAVIQLVGVSASEAGRDVMIKSETNEGVGRTDYYVQGTNAALPHPGAEATLSLYRGLLFA